MRGVGRVLAGTDTNGIVQFGFWTWQGLIDATNPIAGPTFKSPHRDNREVAWPPLPTSTRTPLNPVAGLRNGRRFKRFRAGRGRRSRIIALFVNNEISSSRTKSAPSSRQGKTSGQ
jgi:hypothetical protein